MGINIIKSNDGSEVTIDIVGRFDYNMHQDFRQAYEDANSVMKYIVDMRKTEYMDSSALGMLLLLRERAGGDSANISIVNVNPEIEKILTISNFHKLFNIS